MIYLRMNQLKVKDYLHYANTIPWCTCDIFKFWIKEIYIKFQNKANNKYLLILDQAPSHKNKDVISFM